MTPTRRDFLKTTGVVGAGFALSGATACGPQSESGSVPAAPAPKKLLVLGGTGFIGPHMIRYAVDRGHEVTIFTRGRSSAEVPD